MRIRIAHSSKRFIAPFRERGIPFDTGKDANVSKAPQPAPVQRSAEPQTANSLDLRIHIDVASYRKRNVAFGRAFCDLLLAVALFLFRESADCGAKATLCKFGLIVTDRLRRLRL